MVCTLLAGINVVAFAAEDTLSVACFYNDADKGGDGEHLFTIDQGEMDWLSSLPTWNNQGEAWKAPVSSSLAIYRCYNPNSGEHHYAAAGEAEWLVSQGWTQEKLAFYSDDNMGVPVYRLWNGLAGVGSHYYTINEFEKDILVAGGWQFEGVNFYGVKGEEPTTKALSASQEGSNKIMVSSEDGFTGEESFVVSHGDLVDELADLDYDEELDVYTITLADPIVEAVYTVSCDGYTPATFEGEESEKEMTAVQTGAKEITVVSTTPFDLEDEFEVSHGLIEDTVVNCDFDDDMCTATLTLDSDIVEATYVVECSDEEYDAAEFVGEEAEVTGIVFPSDLLILAPSQTAGATAFVTVDQWGDPIKDNSRNFTVSAGYTKIQDSWNEDTGVGTLGIMSSASPAAVIAEGTKIPVSVVYANSTKVENVVLTASASSVVSNIEVGELMPLDEDLEGLRVTGERMLAAGGSTAKYALPIIATDQYGLPVDYSTLNTMKSNDQLFVTPLSGVVAVGDFAVDPETGITYLQVYCNNPTKNGAETINFLSRSGFSTTASLVVYPMEVIDAVDVIVGDLQVDKAVPFAFVASDQYGEFVDITDSSLYYPLVPGTYNTITVTRKVAGVAQADSPKATISTTYGSQFTISAEGVTLTAGSLSTAAETGQETLNVKTATNKISLPTLKVNKKATPAYVKGFAEDAVLSYANPAAVIDDADQAATYVIIDSYGEEMKAADFVAGGYTLEVAGVSSNKFTSFTGGAIQLNNVPAQQKPTSPVNETYKVTIKDGTGADVSTRNVTVTVAGELTTFVATFVDANLLPDKMPKSNLYVGDINDELQLVLMGADSKGNMVVVPVNGTNIFAVLEDETIAGAQLSCTRTGLVSVANTSAEIKVTENACVDVYTNTGDFITEAEIECSTIPRTPALFVGMKAGEAYDLDEGIAALSDGDATLAGGTVTVDTTGTGAAATTITIGALDQYGQPIAIEYATIGGKDLTGNVVGFDDFAGKTVVLKLVAGNLTQDVYVTIPQA